MASKNIPASSATETNASHVLIGSPRNAAKNIKISTSGRPVKPLVLASPPFVTQVRCQVPAPKLPLSQHRSVLPITNVQKSTHSKSLTVTEPCFAFCALHFEHNPSVYCTGCSCAIAWKKWPSLHAYALWTGDTFKDTFGPHGPGEDLNIRHEFSRRES